MEHERRKLAFIECLVCARHCAGCLIVLFDLVLVTTPVRSVLLPSLTHEETEAPVG